MALDPAGPVARRGWRVSSRPYEGQGRDGAFLEPTDPRVAQLLFWYREAAVFQAVHRLRPALKTTPAQVFLFTSLPIPGLRIARLAGDSINTAHNAEQSRDAQARIAAAAERLNSRGVTITARAMAAEAGASASTITKYHHLWQSGPLHPPQVLL